MSDIVIEFDHVWKKFKKGEKFNSLRDLIPSVAKKLFSGRNKKLALEDKEFWALKDVSFQLKKGEALGIIGSNGAGKSTALKLLSGIMRPNKGSIKAKGRLSALIEVGAGFHPDLTGRENVYLNGSILGMSKKQIDAKFDEIVDFSGIEKFIDTPVKRYSSGMYARLGFSVAAHIDPDLLLVDEVLSVGDLSFQRKCIEKMQSNIANGTTVIFISHNLESVRRLCPQSIFLNSGTLDFMGKTEEAIEHYMKSLDSVFSSTFAGGDKFKGALDKPVQIEKIRLLDVDGIEQNEFNTGEYLKIEINYSAREKVFSPAFVMNFFSSGQWFANINSRFQGYDIEYIDGQGKLSLVIKNLLLLPGFFEARVHIADKECLSSYDIESALFFVREGKRAEGLYFQPHLWEGERLTIK